ncbi:MAG: hypothetical protein IKZ49_04550 [Alphaproteobacteria bacterium]|nr:hypothetical protein [Alphaproteobacteria bacterium]
MKSRYFQSITPRNNPFPPAPRASIRNIPVQEQWDGLMQLLKDADANELRDDYLFYVFWTGFLYALSRSDILALLHLIDPYSINPHSNSLESLLALLIVSYFFRYWRSYLQPNKKPFNPADFPSWLQPIVRELYERDQMQGKNRNNKLVLDVLLEMTQSNNPEIREIRKSLNLVSDILCISTDLTRVFEINKRY